MKEGEWDHCVDASFVAGFDQELDVGVHERDCHSDIATIRKHEFFVIAEFLDKTEDIILDIKPWGHWSIPIDHSSNLKNDLSIRR